MTSDVLYLVGQLRSGGLERQLYYLLRSMDRSRCRPALVVWNFQEHDCYVDRVRALDVPVYGLSTTGAAASKARAVRRLVAQLRPKVVHSYSFYTNIAAHWAALGTSAVAIGSIRSDLAWARQQAGPVLGVLSACRPDHQICNSYAAAAAARRTRNLYLAPKRVYVVRNGIDLAQFRYHPPQPANGHLEILGVGNLLPVKRWDLLLHTTALLIRRRVRCRVRIAGEGPLRRSLEQLAVELGIADCVQFLGHSSDIPALLGVASVVVHTAEAEGCPNAIMEAMACGRAVVAMDAGDVSSLVEDGVTGFVVGRSDHHTLAERLAQLSAHSELAIRMGEAGRAKAEREFSLDRLVPDTFGVYRDAGCTDLAYM